MSQEAQAPIPSAEVRKNLQLFHTPVLMPGGYTFDHVKTLKYIDLYYNSQYESGMIDDNGFRKYFYNIVQHPCDIATKFVDLDTKDIRLISVPGGMEYKLWLEQRDLRDFLTKTDFATFLNQVGEDYPKYGSVVARPNREGKWNSTPIQNVRLNPSSDVMRSSNFVYDVFLMQKWEIEDMKWDPEKKKQLFDANPSKKEFLIYECHHRVSSKTWERVYMTDFLKGADSKGNVIESTEANIDPNIEYFPGIDLFTDTVKDIPHQELHWKKSAGRWLGVGFVEFLLDNQRRENEISQERVNSGRIANKNIFITQDETMGRNILTDMEHGDIIKGTSLNPVNTEEHNQSGLQTEEQRWDKNTQEKTFSFEISQGKALPSQTPLGVANIAENMVTSFFDKKQENFGIFVKNIILFHVLPSFKNQSKSKHLLKFMHTDEDIDKLRKAVSDFTMRKAIWDYAVRTGTIPSKVAIELEKVRLDGAMKKRKDLSFEIPDGFYDDVEEQVDVVVTDEQVDIKAMVQSLTTAMTNIATNPAIMQNPVTRKIFFKLLELAGVSPVELNMLDDQVDDQTQMQTKQQQQVGQGMPPQGQPEQPQEMQMPTPAMTA